MTLKTEQFALQDNAKATTRLKLLLSLTDFVPEWNSTMYTCTTPKLRKFTVQLDVFQSAVPEPALNDTGEKASNDQVALYTL